MNQSDLTQNFVTITPPTEEPISVEGAKPHCTIDYNDLDADLARWIASARTECEAFTKRTFCTTVYELRLNGFPQRCDGTQLITLPMPPAISVESIKYTALDGSEMTLSPDTYKVEVGGSLPGVIVPAYGTRFPETRKEISSVRVRYTAGYGDADNVPQSAKSAMLLLVQHWNKNREAVTDGSKSELPFGVKYVLRPLCWGFVP